MALNVDYSEGQMCVITGAKVLGREAKDYKNDGNVKYRLKVGFIGGMRNVGLSSKADFEAAPPIGSRCELIGFINEMVDDKGTKMVYLSDVSFHPDGTLGSLLTPEMIGRSATRQNSPAPQK